MVEQPIAEVDFRKFVKAKILSWEPEEMIEVCTIIAQDPNNLIREYLVLIQHREDCGEAWSGKGRHTAIFGKHWVGMIQSLSNAANVG